MSGLHWVKSSFSDEGGNNCVEIATTDGGVALRESDSPADVLLTGRSAMLALIRGLKTGAVVAPSESGR